MQLFRFANPDFLYLLLLLPVLAVLFIINEIRKKRAVRRLGNVAVVSTLMPEISGSRSVVKFLFQIVCACCTYNCSGQATVWLKD